MHVVDLFVNDLSGKKKKIKMLKLNVLMKCQHLSGDACYSSPII